MIRHLPDHHHHVGDPVLDLASDLKQTSNNINNISPAVSNVPDHLNDAPVIGDELLGRDTEGGVAYHGLDAPVQ